MYTHVQIPDLMDTLRKKGLVLRIHYIKPAWTLEARDMQGLAVVGKVTDPEFPGAVRALLHELHLMD